MKQRFECHLYMSIGYNMSDYGTGNCFIKSLDGLKPMKLRFG